VRNPAEILDWIIIASDKRQASSHAGSHKPSVRAEVVGRRRFREMLSRARLRPALLDPDCYTMSFALSREELEQEDSGSPLGCAQNRRFRELLPST
jgi:hypothetical protein